MQDESQIRSALLQGKPQVNFSGLINHKCAWEEVCHKEYLVTLADGKIETGYYFLLYLEESHNALVCLFSNKNKIVVKDEATKKKNVIEKKERKTKSLTQGTAEMKISREFLLAKKKVGPKLSILIAVF